MFKKLIQTLQRYSLAGSKVEYANLRADGQQLQPLRGYKEGAMR